MKKIILILMLIVGFTGCANTGPMKPEQKAGIHSVAVVSLLEDKLEFTKVGVFVFNNDYFTKDLPNWGVDDVVRETIQNELQRTSPQIKVVSINFNRSELLKIYGPIAPFSEYADIKRIESELSTTIKSNPVDLLILVHKEHDRDLIQNSNQFIIGNGVYYGSQPFSINPTLRTYSYFNLVILDCKTLNIITKKQIRSVSTNLGRMKISWEDQLKNNLSEAMLKDFQSDLDNLIKDNIKSSLKELGL